MTLEIFQSDIIGFVQISPTALHITVDTLNYVFHFADPTAAYENEVHCPYVVDRFKL